MSVIRRLMLDVLKAHIPNVVEFAHALAGSTADAEVSIRVLEMDDKTESLEVIIEGGDLDFDAITATINALGASVHSVDHVVVVSDSGENGYDADDYDEDRQR